MLTRESILGAVPTFPREEVAVPEWGGSVFVRVLTGTERDRLELEWEKTNRVNFRARLVAYSACDETGKSLFTAKDVDAIGAMPSSALTRLCDVAFRLNRFTKDDVEDLEKNSESGPLDASS